MSRNDSPTPLNFSPPALPRKPRRLVAAFLFLISLLSILLPVALLLARHWVRTAAHDALPQLDGTLPIAGLSAPVTIQRDAHGTPHLHAASLDDLVIAQGFVTAEDRLFQMDLLRRHAAGELAELFGPSVLSHDRLQRTLQLRAAADRALCALPPDQLHLLTLYAQGVNAAIAAQAQHLPVEMRILHYQPASWTPRDSMLVLISMIEETTNTFPTKLAREGLIARLAASKLPAADRALLEQDLYPVGSWRDHPPAQPIPDLTLEGAPIPDVPLDESQTLLTFPTPNREPNTETDPTLTPGSNEWVVSGEHTASGKPLLSNDIHLGLSLPGIWYAADLEAAPGFHAAAFHAAGVTLPGIPLIVVGHNQHIAWGFTILPADVQDVYIEATRGTGASEEFQATDGSWQPVLHFSEPIKVRFGKDVPFEVLATRHGDSITPILNPALLPEATEPNHRSRTLALRWTIYDPAVLTMPTLAVDSAQDWPSFLAAFSYYGGPASNLVYADDQGHIGFHAAGKIPLRGPVSASSPALLQADSVPLATQLTPPMRANPHPLDAADIQARTAPVTPFLSGALSPVPLAPTTQSEWSGYIPFDQLPQVFDPPGGILATANARTTPDGYAYPITLNWAAPYRNERIWHRLAHSKNLTPADMLALQTDIDSDFDRLLAERLTYAFDHASTNRPAPELRTLRAAADLLRTFRGHMSVDSGAAEIVSSVHAVLWPMLLEPKLGVPLDVNALYLWGERDYALEEILMHQPPRWLPATSPNWNDFLASALLRGLKEHHAPAGLASWRYGDHHVVDIEAPVFEQSALLRQLLGLPTGTGPQPQSGDATTIKQVGRTFGPTERFTADLANLDQSTLNLVTGESGQPASPWYLDEFKAWYIATTYTFPFSAAAVASSSTHTLTLTPAKP